MRFAVSTTDLSQFVEDSSHPPSACASPSTVPMMFLSPVLGAGGRGSSSSMLSSSMERLDIGPSGLLADIGEELVMSGNFSRKQINSSLPKRGSGVRKRRRSSICLNDILASFN
jgi:hypothetical protein